jgi:hypothetical protein
MAFIPRHCGLYFSDEHVQMADKTREREPFQSAWNFLTQQQPKSELARAQLDALRYRFDGSFYAGEQAIALLTNGLQFDAETRYLDRITTTLAWAQCYEMLRDHPAQSSAWLATFADTVEHLNRTVTTGFRSLWLNALNMGAGVVLEREDLFMMGADAYRGVVSEIIHPEGYLRGEVEQSDGLGFYRQLRSVQALVLMAEMALQVGEDLWSYEVRGVSVMTAVTYVMYYYFRPDKWRWDDGLEDVIVPFVRKHAGFWEMVNRHAQPRDLKPLLDDLRPIFDAQGGGLTTLTHGVATRRGLFG